MAKKKECDPVEHVTALGYTMFKEGGKCWLLDRNEGGQPVRFPAHDPDNAWRIKMNAKLNNVSLSKDDIQNALDEMLFFCEKSADVELSLRIRQDGDKVIIGHSSGPCYSMSGKDGLNRCDERTHEFRKGSGLPLPTIRQGHSMVYVKDQFPLKDDDDWLLMLMWLANALQPRCMKFIGVFMSKEAWTGKSTMASQLNYLINPKKLGQLCSHLRVSDDDFKVKLHNNYAVVFDDVDRISQSQLAKFKRNASGVEDGRRELWTNNGETTTEFNNPIILTSNTNIFLDDDDAGFFRRCLPIFFNEVIPTCKRKHHEVVMEQFAAKHAEMLGAILDNMVRALRMPAVPYDRRLADELKIDFDWAAKFIKAAGGDPDRALQRLKVNRQRAKEQAIIEWPLMNCIFQHAQNSMEAESKGETIELYAAQLVATLRGLGAEMVPNELKIGGELRRHESMMEAIGVTYTTRKEHNKTLYRFRLEDTTI